MNEQEALASLGYGNKEPQRGDVYYSPILGYDDPTVVRKAPWKAATMGYESPFMMGKPPEHWCLLRIIDETMMLFAPCLIDKFGEYSLRGRIDKVEHGPYETEISCEGKCILLLGKSVWRSREDLGNRLPVARIFEGDAVAACNSIALTVRPRGERGDTEHDEAREGPA